MANMHRQWIRDPCAYCALHHFAMTVKDVRKRKCIDKHCKHLRRMKHPWWETRKQQREWRAERERKRKEIWGK